MQEGELLMRVQTLFLENGRTTNGFQYTLPSPQRYPYQWYWDSCFHSMVLRHFDIERAKAELRSLVSKQFKNGCIPHVIYWDKKEIFDVDWGVEGTSSITQPPLLSIAVWKIYEVDKEISFLREMYEPLRKLCNYLINERLHPSRNVFGIINPDESGEDTSPRFDIPQGLSHRHLPQESFDKRKELFEAYRECDFRIADCMARKFWVEDITFNSFALSSLEALASISSELNDIEESDACLQQIEKLRKSMRENLMDEGIFRSYFGFEKQKPISDLTWAKFAPLYAGLYEKSEARVLIEGSLTNPEEFWTPFPVPSVSKASPVFNHQHSERTPGHSSPNWRGPTWMASNYFVYHGLIRYGFNDIARELKERSIKLINKSGFREYYDPLSGEGYGAEKFTWGGLVLDMNE